MSVMMVFLRERRGVWTNYESTKTVSSAMVWRVSRKRKQCAIYAYGKGWLIFKHKLRPLGSPMFVNPKDPIRVTKYPYF